MDRTENRICWYSSLLIALMINSPRLLALRENGIIARYWHFSLGEWSFQVLFNLAFCWLLFFLNLNNRSRFAIYRNQKKYGLYILYNSAIVLTCIIAGSAIQRVCFGYKGPPGILGSGYFARFVLSAVLTGIIIKIILLMRESKKKDLENQQLKSAYMVAELELLKEQMNPHFLFNSLSSLSGVIREDPEMAQKYIRELSNVFRYAITQPKANLVTVEAELSMLRSFAQLINLRLEGAFQLDIQVCEPYLLYKLPHLSLQPLLENAVKHNAATLLKPLKVVMDIQQERLVISNNIWHIRQPESSNGIGLANLNERFKIMMQQEIEIINTGELFIVKLPLKA
ncbi:sensor histidine kinase [Mucilaginibacter pocheonensis]|uniref:Sensor histidine kinase YesM n=1 Tax=Mucilaginibacter pocheonensis TaxID=398050 RepID=A0ABU1TA17_9SPHI|nr:histidine kinase [Mucilaginibacter pocheonensis]MDR6941670.1 sensor histidine kinase YesM [Mucilaginibacter pocheonensis]